MSCKVTQIYSPTHISHGPEGHSAPSRISRCCHVTTFPLSLTLNSCSYLSPSLSPFHPWTCPSLSIPLSRVNTASSSPLHSPNIASYWVHQSVIDDLGLGIPEIECWIHYSCSSLVTFSPGKPSPPLLGASLPPYFWGSFLCSTGTHSPAQFTGWPDPLSFQPPQRKQNIDKEISALTFPLHSDKTQVNFV